MSVHILGLRLGFAAPVQVSTSTRRRALSVCSQLQATSASLLTVFAIIHLSSPLIGLVHLGSGDVNDRIDAVSRWMLLGRVAYQSTVGEMILWGSLATHLAAGVGSRLLKICTRPSTSSDTAHDSADNAADRAAGRRGTPTISVAHKAGYALTPVVLHHIYIHRWLPSSTHPTIAQLSPSELDYSFVSFGLSHPNVVVRVSSALSYAALIGAFATHVVYAFPAMQRSLPLISPKNNPTSTGKKAARHAKKWTAATLAALLLSSVVAITPFDRSARLAISGLVRDRYDAVMRTAFPSRYFY